MSRSRYVFPVPGSALISAWREGYTLGKLKRDIMAGLTIGVVAVPLSMALAIATGVPPQHGLYTAIVAGAVIALTGGSRFNISGPTAAFVVILFPIVASHGLGGLLIATLMAGAILVALGLSRLGSLIQYVPYPVILGFTAGIGVVIALLQLPDFLGLSGVELGDSTLHNLMLIGQALPRLSPAEISVGLITLATLIIWPRLNTPIPAPLVGLAMGTLTAALLMMTGVEVDTIASRFSWEFEGQTGGGIPPFAPGFTAPWHFPGADGTPLEINFTLIQSLLGPALAIALLAAIESLLCATVADGLTRTRHDPNAELIGQGLGNMVVPFFGGITATAALARTATNIKSGACSPVAAVVHSLVVLLAVVALAGVLGYVPMAALAALLFIIAWNMSEARHFVHTLKSAPASDVTVLVICFALTVIFDMVIAVAVGIGLAAALFIRRMAQLTHTQRLAAPDVGENFPPEVALYKISGPLFFGAAEKAIATLRVIDHSIRIVVLDMRDVSSLDTTGMVALDSLRQELGEQDVGVIFVGLPPRMALKIKRAGIKREAGKLAVVSNLAHAEHMARRWLGWRNSSEVTAGN
ncbi:C4-dicarboxylic acid transporter DauA [Halomonas janggokensis]|uniref:C4-dicarboxylic acid transporter DauA n=1 Tax=Vreelandella janggokensis TaxID=370767 RepID=A0ABT4IVZ0_9GAMM|nr:C4-dicarboxylic acid transporter DauA [Halomonas janggokensis]MCZ0927842.1 C4-dicarboxylic acid transporter DauA [Halomonas janggokensis]MCZ0930700.1 C4-dicarboxylic acid transporter DauA [Halomonas janggokensis]